MSSKILSLGSMYFQIGSFHFPLTSDSLLDREIVGGNYEIETGGSAVNFVLTCKAFGLEPIFIGKRGDDLPGRELEKMFQKAGVTLDAIVSPDHQTNLALNFSSDKGNAVMFVSGSANSSLGYEEILGKLKNHSGDVKYLYLGGIFKLKTLIPELHKIIDLAHEKNMKVVLDHGRITNVVTDEDIKIIQNIIPEIDIYLPSHEELIGVLGAGSLSDAIEKVKKVSQNIIAIKNSSKGAIGIEKEHVVEVPSFPVSVVSPVGAGDTFNAGFISALDMGKDLESAIRFGSAAAALKISSRNQPSRELINKMLDEK